MYQADVMLVCSTQKRAEVKARELRIAGLPVKAVNTHSKRSFYINSRGTAARLLLVEHGIDWATADGSRDAYHYQVEHGALVIVLDHP